MAVGLFQEFRLADRGPFASIAHTAEMGILKVTHRHTHAAAETEIGAWVDVAGMGCGEDRGEGLGIGICVGMGIGNDKVGRTSAIYDKNPTYSTRWAGERIAAWWILPQQNPATEACHTFVLLRAAFDVYQDRPEHLPRSRGCL